MDTNNPTTSVPASAGAQIFRDDYQHLVDEIRNVPSAELAPINLDIPTAVTTALGAMPEIMSLRSEIVRDMPNFDIARLDKLSAYTGAVYHAHVVYQAASAPIESIDQLSTECVAIREVLVADATALAKRNLIDGHRLTELKGPVGFRNLAGDVLVLLQILRDNWTNIAGKTALQVPELEKAEGLATRLLTAVGLREQGPALIAEAALNRQRAFTLFLSAYDHARRVVAFLRWNEADADTIAPSLYAGRGTGRRKAEVQPTVPTPPVVAVPPAATPVTAPTNGAIAAKSVGFPNSEPFTGR